MIFSSILPTESFYQRSDYLPQLIGRSAAGLLAQRRSALYAQLLRENWLPTIELLRKIQLQNGSGYRIEEGIIKTTFQQSSSPEILSQVIRSILPWRRGPWQIAGEYIDSEWRSQIKFAELTPFFSDFKGKSILDVGSDNGYYAVRLHALGAASVLCLDPAERCFLQFELFQKFAQQDNLQFELLGYQDAPALGACFDHVLCMGVLYHHRSPLAVLEACRSALKPGGKLFLESMTYPSKESVNFFPPDRYAKARNVYFLPSAAAMVSMCQRSGFKNVELVSERVITSDEQRRTPLAPYESLSDFLDANDSSKTVEGWPAPQRALVIASI